MSNWCVNRVSLEGDPGSVLQAVQLFKKITYDQETNRHPEPPDFLIREQANMVDFAVSGNGLWFRTPWTPAIGTVEQIARHFGVDYIHRYEEPGMKVYGEASIRNGVFSNICIERKDLAKISFNGKTGAFMFEGRSYEDDWTILTEVLDRKRAQLSEQFKIPVKMEQRQLSQVELLAWRLAGRLPHIDINGTDFTIDLRLQELRETASPWNAINLSEMETALDSDEYEFFYDTLKHNIWQFEDDVTEMPENVVMVTLPEELVLDPVAAARAVGYEETKFLEEYPIQQGLKAGVRPLSETFFPQFIAENRQAKNGTDPENGEERPHRPGR